MTDMIDIEVPAAIPPEVKVPRIKCFTLCNFRAFAGPSPVPIPLGGKNAVIFGENGSGKSSIFHALDGFFSVTERSAPERRRRLLEAVNLFSGLSLDDTWLEVEFDDKVIERWDKKRHPCDPGIPGQVSSRVFAAGYRKAILDYRSLLETNFRHSAGKINLFETCVLGVLRDFTTPHEGSEASLRDLWNVLLAHCDPPPKSYRDPKQRESYRLSFNDGLSAALDALVPTINEMLVEMGWKDVVIERFDFPRLTYNNQWILKFRNFTGREIRPILRFNGTEIGSPHLFLNEARLSALALAIYFAGRKLCAATIFPDTPRLMVLDDVIIGLDQSNRLPILDLLAKHFKDWQIIILTHDRFWFDMTRSYHRRHKADRFWQYWELHPGANITLPPTPLLTSSSAPRQALDLAISFLGQEHVNAAGNAARIAAERALREFCEVKHVPIRYRIDGEKIPFSDLMLGAKEWSNKSASAFYTDALSDVEMYSEILLNRLSHGGTSSLTKHEVQGAIVAVKSLLLALKVVSKYEAD